MTAGMSELAKNNGQQPRQAIVRCRVEGLRRRVPACSEMNATCPLQDSTCLLFLTSMDEQSEENGMAKLIVISRWVLLSRSADVLMVYFRSWAAYTQPPGCPGCR